MQHTPKEHLCMSSMTKCYTSHHYPLPILNIQNIKHAFTLLPYKALYYFRFKNDELATI